VGFSGFYSTPRERFASAREIRVRVSDSGSLDVFLDMAKKRTRELTPEFTLELTPHLIHFSSDSVFMRWWCKNQGDQWGFDSTELFRILHFIQTLFCSTDNNWNRL